jgi:hypothetical protein
VGAGLGLGHVAVELFLTCSTRHLAAPADWAAASPSAAEKAMAAHTRRRLPTRLRDPSLTSRSCRMLVFEGSPSEGRGPRVQDPRALRTSPSVTRLPNRSAAYAVPISLPSGEGPVIVRRRFPPGSASCGLHALGDFLPTGYAIPSFEVEATNQEAYALCGEEVR